MAPAPTVFASERLVPVQLKSVPVSLAAKNRQHNETLLREFALLVADLAAEATPANDLQAPAQLLDVVVRLTQVFHGLNDEAERVLEDAIASGAETIDSLVLELPPEAAEAARAIAQAFDDADYYCWSGERLVHLATPEDCAAYRRWVISQVLDQLDGRTPVRWPDSIAASTLRRS
jgi:hypothetical protein